MGSWNFLVIKNWLIFYIPIKAKVELTVALLNKLCVPGQNVGLFTIFFKALSITGCKLIRCVDLQHTPNVVIWYEAKAHP